MNVTDKYLKKFQPFFNNRGLIDIKSIDAYLKPEDNWLNDPSNFYNMDIAVDQIISNPKESPIFIHGDCDADGVSACSVLYTYLKKNGYKVFYHIPNRSNEGHSISLKTIDYAASIGSKLMITCDLGMSSFDEVKYANEKKIKTIITDHHKPLSEVPDAISIINPWIKQNENLPFKEYSGSAVALKLCHGVNNKLSLDFENIKQLMGIASIGIISDKVTIINENRLISYYGYKMITEGQNLGISILSKRLFPYLSKIDINKIIRVINMTTKLEDSNLSVKLLTSSTPVQINSYANTVIKKFRKNQTIFNSIIHSSIRQVYSQNYIDNNCIFIETDFDSAYNGAVANTLSSKFQVPAIVLSKMGNNTHYKGSCRGVGDTDLFSFLDINKKYLKTLGGHPRAAGFTIDKDKIIYIKKSFFEFMKVKKIVKKTAKSRVIDGILELNDINLELVSFFEQFMPYGSGNNCPIFYSEGVKVVDKPIVIGKSKDSIKLKVKQNGSAFDSVGIGLINEFEKLVTKNKLNIEYTISNNDKQITLNILGVS